MEAIPETVKSPAKVRLPVEVNLNWLVELVWKLTKSPLKVTGLAAKRVPDAEPPWIEN